MTKGRVVVQFVNPGPVCGQPVMETHQIDYCEINRCRAPSKESIAFQDMPGEDACLQSQISLPHSSERIRYSLEDLEKQITHSVMKNFAAKLAWNQRMLMMVFCVIVILVAILCYLFRLSRSCTLKRTGAKDMSEWVNIASNGTCNDVNVYQYLIDN